MSHRQFAPLVVALLGLGLASGCDRPKVVGSGVMKSETRPIAGVKAVKLYGVGNLKVTFGDEESLTVRADDNLLPFVKSEVSDGTLAVGVGPGSYSWNGWPEITLTLKTLAALELSGQTTATVEGLEGAGLTVQEGGQCAVTVSGRVPSQTVSVAGQSRYQAEALDCAATTVVCSGQSRAVVMAKASLVAEASGQSHIEYLGTPASRVVQSSGQSEIVARPAAAAATGPAPVED